MKCILYYCLMQIWSSGKLMITGEYVALQGAECLALATQKGQQLTVSYAGGERDTFSWIAKDIHAKVWFECAFSKETLHVVSTTDSHVSDRLSLLLKTGIDTNPSFLEHVASVVIELEFDRSWGLGSSSTLVACMAKWIKIDPFKLLYAVWQGSGYDVAVGMKNQSIRYRWNQMEPKYEGISWNPSFSHQLYFVYLNKKQDSAVSVKAFRHEARDEDLIERISEITNEVIQTNSYAVFKMLLVEHNFLLERKLNKPNFTQTLFPFFDGLVKPLGAWGGDFVMIGIDKKEDPRRLFIENGYSQIIPFDQMILNHHENKTSNDLKS